MRAVIAAAAGFTLAAGFLATPAHAGSAAPERIVEQLDRGLVAVPAENGGTYLSWRLLGTEHGNNVYKGAKRLNKKPIDESTNFTYTTPGTGVYTVRAVVKNREQAPSGPAITPGDIPLLPTPTTGSSRRSPAPTRSSSPPRRCPRAGPTITSPT
ncbi:hypothetical protein [Actinoplanes sp. NPDC049802]|uniref:rhamnogalacturonan endolyase family protein n=1 Tax=Actinoplanes sp. NPDC049802 TaxID=3154742 RepID=UPI0033EB40F6